MKGLPKPSPRAAVKLGLLILSLVCSGMGFLALQTVTAAPDVPTPEIVRGVQTQEAAWRALLEGDAAAPRDVARLDLAVQGMLALDARPDASPEALPSPLAGATSGEALGQAAPVGPRLRGILTVAGDGDLRRRAVFADGVAQEGERVGGLTVGAIEPAGVVLLGEGAPWRLASPAVSYSLDSGGVAPPSQGGER